jgi:hypothetical protein
MEEGSQPAGLSSTGVGLVCAFGETRLRLQYEKFTANRGYPAVYLKNQFEKALQPLGRAMNLCCNIFCAVIYKALISGM